MIIRSRAPLRLGLAGGGTDVSPYCDEYGGYVLNATINLYAYCTIEPIDNDEVCFIAIDKKESFQSKALSRFTVDQTLPLHKGVYNRIVKDYNNEKPLCFRLTTYADAPAGSGLGTSSTLVVAIIKAFVEWLKLPLGEYDIAKLAFEIERKDLMLEGGKQDQYAATFGGFNFIEFNDNDRVIVNPLRIKNWVKNELESSLLLYYMGTSRDSSVIIKEQIKNVSNHNEKNLEAMHDLKRSAMTMKEAVLTANFKLFSECLRYGWIAKKKTSAVVSNPKIEELYNYIMQNGGISAKVSGAGGGGFMMIYCNPLDRMSLIQALRETDGTTMTVKFTEKGTEGWVIGKGDLDDCFYKG